MSQKCSFDPRTYGPELPIGMFHCPECGEMVIAGMEHPNYEEDDMDRSITTFDQALRHHLQYEVGINLPDVAIEALAAAKDGDWDREISLPAGSILTARTIIIAWHLEGFLDDDPETAA